MSNWLNVPDNHDFSIHNLPFGVFDSNGSATIGVAFGDQILNLSALTKAGLFSSLSFDDSVFHADVLNPFMALGRKVHSDVRLHLQEELNNDNSIIRSTPNAMVPMNGRKMLLPIEIGDYTDFYSSIEHATNVGKMFRPDNPLLPNWKHIPVGYHGRSSSIVVSGTNFPRPKGQLMPPGADAPVFGPSKRMDFELEMAFITCGGKPMGETISTDEAEEYIFGMALFNDWSARDIQKWEYVPLGPFLGKNFASTISPWIITMDALQPFRVQGPKQDPEPLPYLKCKKDHSYDIKLEVSLQPGDQDPTILCRSNYKYMYWNMAQQLAHHTINGCNIRTGDMMASGTISGPQKGSFGSMLEISWGGKEPIDLKTGGSRTFIDDMDHIHLRAWCEKDGKRIGFGPCTGQVLPAND